MQIREIFAGYTPIIEPLSLDEAYLDVTENLKPINSATQIVEEIRARIRAETELTASAGVSYNKFLAKLASDHRKPNGLFVISPKMGPEFVETLPVRKFHGVGPATAGKMQRLGIKTGLDLRTRSELEQLGNALLESRFPVAKGLRLLGISLSSLAVEEAEREPEFGLPRRPCFVAEPAESFLCHKSLCL